MADLTKKQVAILNYIRVFIKSNGWPPTRAEIAAEFGMNSNAAQYQVEQLNAKGMIKLSPNIQRGIKLL